MTMVLEEGAVARGGSVEGDLRTHSLLGPSALRLGLAGNREAGGLDFEIVDALSPGAGARVERGADHVAQIAGRMHRVHLKAVRRFARGPAHALVHPREVDGDVRVLDGAGIEEVVDQSETVETALVVGPGAGLEGTPDCRRQCM